MNRPNRWAAARMLALAFLLVVLAAAARLAVPDDAMDAVLGAVEGLGSWGPVAFVLVYAVATVAMLPGSPLTLAAGAIFGPFPGALLATTGATLGAAGALLIGRYLARAPVARWAERHPRWRAFDRAIGAGGWKVVALLRLSPAVPFNLQNYLYGVTSIGFWPCALTSWFTMLPGAFLYASLGAVGRAGLAKAAGSSATTPWASLALGLAATLVLTVYLGRLAARALREAGEEPLTGESTAAEERPDDD